MPPVIVAIAGLAAYGGAVALAAGWGFGAFASALFGSVVAYGVGYAGQRAFGLGGSSAELAPFSRANTWLSNEPNSQRALPVVYGRRRIGGTVVFADVNGARNEYLDVVYAICEGPVAQIAEMYLDDAVVPEYAPADQVEGAVDRAVLTLTGTILREITVRLRLVEGTDVSASSGSLNWLDLQTWAGTYGGELELTRHHSESGETSWQFALAADPFAYTGDAEDLQLTLDVPRRAAAGIAVSVVEEPSPANGHTVLLRLRRVGVTWVTPVPFSIEVIATAHSPGDTEYLGIVRCNRHLGTDDQGADLDLVADSSTWSPSHRLSGIAYCHVRYVFSAHNWTRGIPQASWMVYGRPLYDPRTDDTSWSENPALAIRDLLVNTRYGAGLALGMVDDEAIAAVADYCDELVDDGSGGDEPRYACNGALDTGRTLKDRLESLLPCCRSWLVYAGGLYRLVADAPADPVMTFNEDNILGEWAIDLGENAGMANRVGAVFWDPADAWRPGSVVADNEVARSVEDNGVMLERELQLEFTVSRSMAYRMAVLALNSSRLPMTVRFTALPSGIRCLPGDVIAINHGRPGWSGQLLRVVEMLPRPDGHIEITGKQYSVAAYDHGEILVGATAPGTNLPTPLVVERPGRPQLSESLYATRDGQGVKVRLGIDLGTRAGGSWVRSYLIEVLGPGDEDWRALAAIPVESPTSAVYDAAPGVWAVRAYAINHLGVVSAASDVSVLEVLGLSAPPAAVTGMTGYALSGMAVLFWDRHTDLDVRIGGLIRIRIYLGSGSPAWDDGLELGHVPGISEGGTFPLVDGIYMAKAVDSTGQESAAIATIAIAAAEHPAWSLLTTFSPATAWSGTHDETEVVAGALQLEEDGSEVASTAGTWTASVTTDLGAVKVVRLRASLTTHVSDLANNIDLKSSPIDSWPSFDGETSLVVGMRAYMLVRYSDDAATWSTWRRILAADVRARYLQWRVALFSGSVNHNIVVTAASVTVQELA